MRDCCMCYKHNSKQTQGWCSQTIRTRVDMDLSLFWGNFVLTSTQSVLLCQLSRCSRVRHRTDFLCVLCWIWLSGCTVLWHADWVHSKCSGTSVSTNIDQSDTNQLCCRDRRETDLVEFGGYMDQWAFGGVCVLVLEMFFVCLENHDSSLIM